MTSRSYLVDHWIEDLLAKQHAGNSELTIQKSDARIMRVFDIETLEVEH
jgi:hypothetical protein